MNPDSGPPRLSPLDDPWLEPDELEDPIYDEVFRMVYVQRVVPEPEPDPAAYTTDDGSTYQRADAAEFEEG